MGEEVVRVLPAPRSLHVPPPRAPRPRWPIELEMLFPPPVHQHTSPDFPEPYIKPAPRIDKGQDEKEPRKQKGGECVEREETKESALTGEPDKDTAACEEEVEVYSCERDTGLQDAMEKSGIRYSVFRAPPKEGIDLPPKYTLAGEDDTTLVFESRFESGNLQRAVRRSTDDYVLTLRPDLRTVRHTQWFYFRVSNIRAGRRYSFEIVNLMKSSSLYNDGMQPVVYSERLLAEKGIGWHRAGENISYFRNGRTENIGGRKTSLHSLRFEYTSEYDHDVVYFAHSYPYTYTDLQEYLLEVMQRPGIGKICKKRTLCHTIAGNQCDLLTITNYGSGSSESRLGVVVTARIHPGESNSSWMMKGLLDFLVGNDPDAVLLRDTFVFKIIPMLNPDGVIVGNYRCNLSGSDLNRTHRNPSQNLHPTVFHTKAMIKTFAKEREVVMYCDFHGHSRQHGVFLYGCDNRDDPEKRLMERIFPLILSKNAGHLFNYRKCKFRVQRSKRSTGRVVGWREYMILNSFTMEATFAGANFGPEKGRQFNIRDFEMIGRHFCDALLDYCDPDPGKNELLMLELRAKVREKIKAQLGFRAPADLRIEDFEFESDLESSTDGSDSSDSEPETSAMDLQPSPMLPKKISAGTRRLSLKKHEAPPPEASAVENESLGDDDTSVSSLSEQASAISLLGEPPRQPLKSVSPPKVYNLMPPNALDGDAARSPKTPRRMMHLSRNKMSSPSSPRPSPRGLRKAPKEQQQQQASQPPHNPALSPQSKPKNPPSVATVTMQLDF